MESTSQDLQQQQTQIKRGRCQCCNSKLKPVNFPCKKCQFVFCLNCRLPETHNCDYDYTQDKVILTKVVKDKIDRI